MNGCTITILLIRNCNCVFACLPVLSYSQPPRTQCHWTNGQFHFWKNTKQNQKFFAAKNQTNIHRAKNVEQILQWSTTRDAKMAFVWRQKTEDRTRRTCSIKMGAQLYALFNFATNCFANFCCCCSFIHSFRCSKTKFIYGWAISTRLFRQFASIVCNADWDESAELCRTSSDQPTNRHLPTFPDFNFRWLLLFRPVVWRRRRRLSALSFRDSLYTYICFRMVLICMDDRSTRARTWWHKWMDTKCARLHFTPNTFARIYFPFASPSPEKVFKTNLLCHFSSMWMLDVVARARWLWHSQPLASLAV